MAVEMSRRRKVVEEICSREGLGKFAVEGSNPKVIHPRVLSYENFYFDPKHKLAWCPIYKSASTSWLHNFCLLAGLTEEDLRHSKLHVSELARKFYPQQEFEDGEKAINNSKVKFMIVRHPFERLLSAYRDKLENKTDPEGHGTTYFYKKYGNRIVANYRNKGLLNSKNISRKKGHKKTRSNERSEPTFEEFLKYLTDSSLESSGDEHWMPYYLFCTPCFIQYDVIAKFETLDRDQRFIIKLAHLERKIQPQWKHRTSGVNSSDLAKRYFSKIPKSLLLKLYDRYRLDFEMFEYSMNEYLNYVR